MTDAPIIATHAGLEADAPVAERPGFHLVDPSPWNSPQLPSGYATFFSNVQGDYWSSTVPHINDTYPVKVSIWYGEMVRFDRGSTFYVWPVRGGGR